MCVRIYVIKCSCICIHLKNMIHTGHMNISTFCSLWLSLTLIAQKNSQDPILGVCSMSSPSHYVPDDSWKGYFSF